MDEKIQSLIDKLNGLNDYYTVTRQAGHTTAMLRGANNTSCIILAHSPKMSGYLARRLPTGEGNSVVFSSVSQLRGCNKPLLIDNAAVHELVKECLEVITSLNKPN